MSFGRKDARTLARTRPIGPPNSGGSRTSDFARHSDFMPQICQPYRAKTKGKVERFTTPPLHPHYVPLATRVRAAGLVIDVETANIQVRRWLRTAAKETQRHAHIDHPGSPPHVVPDEERKTLAVHKQSYV